MFHLVAGAERVSVPQLIARVAPVLELLDVGKETLILFQRRLKDADNPLKNTKRC